MLDKSFLYSKKPANWDDPKFKMRVELHKVLVNDLAFEQPSKIQACTIPVIVAEPCHSLIAQSQNGTGKTLAFVLSSLIRTDEKSNDIQVVVVSPNRELAKQTYDVYLAVTKYLPGIKISLVVPDVLNPELGHVIVGTPMSLLKLIDRKQKMFADLKMLIFDEADIAFNAKDEISKQSMIIYKKTGSKKQILLFSATFNPDIMKYAQEMVKSATIMKLDQKQLTLKGVVQLYIRCEPQQKFQPIVDIYKDLLNTQTIAFCNTKSFAEKAYKFLTSHDVKAGRLIGAKSKFSEEGMSSAERDAAIKSFKSHETSVLITTNVLARGYDNRYVTFVINLDLPRKRETGDGDPDSYLHRIGRTGRFGDIGVALNIVQSEDDLKIIKQMEEFYQCKINETTIEKLSKQIKEVAKLRKKAYKEIAWKKKEKIVQEQPKADGREEQAKTDGQKESK